MKEINKSRKELSLNGERDFYACVHAELLEERLSVWERKGIIGKVRSRIL